MDTVQRIKADVLLKCKQHLRHLPHEQKNKTNIFSSAALGPVLRDWSCGIKKASVLFQVSHALFGKVGIWDPRINIGSPERDGYSCLNTAQGKWISPQAKQPCRTLSLALLGKLILNLQASGAPRDLCSARPEPVVWHTWRVQHCGGKWRGTTMQMKTDKNCVLLFCSRKSTELNSNGKFLCQRLKVPFLMCGVQHFLDMHVSNSFWSPISFFLFFFPGERIMSPRAEPRVNSCAFVLWVVTGNQQCIHLPNALHRGDCFQLHSVIESISDEWQTASTDHRLSPRPQPRRHRHTHKKRKINTVLLIAHIPVMWNWNCMHTREDVVYSVICRRTIFWANITGTEDRNCFQAHGKRQGRGEGESLLVQPQRHSTCEVTKWVERAQLFPDHFQSGVRSQSSSHPLLPSLPSNVQSHLLSKPALSDQRPSSQIARTKSSAVATR